MWTPVTLTGVTSTSNGPIRPINSSAWTSGTHGTTPAALPSRAISSIRLTTARSSLSTWTRCSRTWGPCRFASTCEIFAASSQRTGAFSSPPSPNTVFPTSRSIQRAIAGNGPGPFTVSAIGADSWNPCSNRAASRSTGSTTRRRRTDRAPSVARSRASLPTNDKSTGEVLRPEGSDRTVSQVQRVSLKDFIKCRGLATSVKAVIPAAGLGTRFLPYTKAQPKEMIPLVDKPAIQFVVEEAVASGMREILIVTGRTKRAIEDHFDTNVELDNHLEKSGRPTALEDLKALMSAARIMYVQQTSSLGLDDAVLRAADFVAHESFGLLLGDDVTVDPPCAGVLRAVHDKLGRSVIALQEVPREQIGRYGMAVGKEVEPGVIRLDGLVEKPSHDEARSNRATIGRDILTPEIFSSLRKTGEGRGGEIQLTDGIRLLMEKEAVYGVLYRGRRYDVGDKVGWLTANLELAMERDDLRPGLMEFVDQFRKRS